MKTIIKTMCVAKVLYDMYYAEKGVHMDEMKMHKLMYFSQRESLMYNKEPLFDATFYGWKYGPVLTEVRSEFRMLKPFSNVEGTVSEHALKLLKSVLNRYGSLSLEAMKVDATKELVARKVAIA